MRKLLRKIKPEAMRSGIASWFRTRVDLEPILAVMAKKTVPSHRLSWIYLLGGAALFLFALQVFSGCLLMLYYQPAEATAYESVTRIMEQVPYGWLVRSLHVWGAHLFIATVMVWVIPAEAVGQRGSGLPLPRFVSLRSAEVNMRAGPSVRYPVEWVYRRAGLPVEVIAEFDTWRKVRDW